MRWLGVIAAVLAGGSLVGLLLRTRDGGGPSATTAGDRSAPGASAEATLAPGPERGPALEGRAPLRGAGTLALSGRARRRDGSKAVGAVVTARPDRSGAEEVARTVVDAAGEFRLEGLEAGLHRIEASLPDGDLELGSVSYAAAGLEGHTITLAPRPAVLEILVTGPGGAPVPRFDALLAKGPRRVGLPAAKEGRIEVPLEKGLWSMGLDDLEGSFLEVWGARDGEGRGLPLAAARTGPLHRSTRRVDLCLAVGPTIEGRVVAPSGAIEGTVTVRVAVGPPGLVDAGDLTGMLDAMLGTSRRAEDATPPPPPFAGATVEVTLDGEGRFRVPGLGSTEPRAVGFVVSDAYLAPEDVVAVPGGPEVVVRLRRAAAPVVTVRTADGAPVAGAHVSAFPHAEADPAPGDPVVDSGWASTDESGAAALSRLDPEGRYALHVGPPQPPPGALEGDGGIPPLYLLVRRAIDPWRPADTEVRLEAGAAVLGVVRDPRGAPVASAWVTLEVEGDADSGARTETTGADGRFAFPGVPGRGHARVRAAWARAPEGEEDRDGASPSRAALALRPGANRVELTLAGRHAVRIVAEGESSAQEGLATLLDLLAGRSATVLRQGTAAWEAVGPATRLQDGSGWIAQGLEPAVTYAVWITSRANRYAYAGFPSDAGTVRVAWQEGGSVTVRVAPAGRAAECQVILRDVLARSVTSTRRGGGEGTEFRFDGLPPSTWSVVVHGPGLPWRGWTAERTVATGGTLEITVPDRAEPREDAPPGEDVPEPEDPAIEEPPR